MSDQPEVETGAPQESSRPRKKSLAAFRALRHRDFALFWSGLIISATGSWMQVVAQGWLVYSLTHSKAYLGIIGAVSTVPVLLLTLPSGVIADRFDKRKICIVTQTLFMIQAFVLAGLTYAHLIRVWHIVALAAFAGLVNALDMPARQAMTIEMVGKEDLMNGVALGSSAFNAARIIGPAIAGVVIDVSHGAGMCFLINAISFVAVVISLFIIRPVSLGSSRADESMVGQIKEGLGYARKDKLTRDLLVLTGIMSIFVLQYATLMPALAEDVLHAGARGLGVLLSAAGLGALTAATGVAAIGHKFKSGIVMAAGSTMSPIALVALAMTHNFLISVVCLVFVGFGTMLFLAVSSTVIQVVSPDDMRGRMLSVRTLVFVGLAPVGSLQIGSIAQRFGVQKSLLFGGVVCLVATVFITIQSRAVRRAV